VGADFSRVDALVSRALRRKEDRPAPRSTASTSN